MKANESTYRVLVVDDDCTLREVVSRAVQRMGHIVVTARDAETALEHATTARDPFDVVITDVDLPGMDGIELLEVLRTRIPTQCVVVVTGRIDEALARAALEKGAAKYLVKPFGLDELEAAVSTAIRPNTST